MFMHVSLMSGLLEDGESLLSAAFSLYDITHHVISI